MTKKFEIEGYYKMGSVANMGNPTARINCQNCGDEGGQFGPCVECGAWPFELLDDDHEFDPHELDALQAAIDPHGEDEDWTEYEDRNGR